MKLALWMKQDGEGCDYTIGCGQKLITLDAGMMGAAIIEAKEIIREHTHDECTIAEAHIVQVMEDLSDYGYELRLYHEKQLLDEVAMNKKRLEMLQREIASQEDEIERARRFQ